MRTQVSVVKCDSYEPALVWQAVKKSLDALGGISVFIKPGSKVLVKPNLLMAKEPEFGITTHPEVVRAVVRLLKDINCRIFIGDGPSVWGGQAQNLDAVYEKTGIKRVCAEEGAELVKFDKRRWRGKFPLTSWLDDCDSLVSIPKFKTHELTLLTAGIKNLYGLVSDSFKTELHKKHFEPEDFSRVLVDIYEEVKPALTVIDGVMGMEGDGPATSGKLRELGLIIAGKDCVALDSIAALVMGIKPQDVLTNLEAARRGLGEMDLKNIQVIGESLDDIVEESFILPATSSKLKIPRPFINFVKQFIRFYPKINHAHCSRCAACIEVCPQKIISLKDERIVIDYSGCISCFCCQEACPSAAIKIKKSLLAKLLGL